jgi:broad specificity phosphatase PhoE
MDADPSLILVMRHAEKSLDPADPDLSPAGEARAQALATYIPQTFEPLDFLYAAAISKHSARPYETVKPLSLKTVRRSPTTTMHSWQVSCFPSRPSPKSEF